MGPIVVYQFVTLPGTAAMGHQWLLTSLLHNRDSSYGGPIVVYQFVTLSWTTAMWDQLLLTSFLHWTSGTSALGH